MDRRVRAIKRDRRGNIIALCNPGESWSPRRKADVIKDIASNRLSYYVKELERPAYLRILDGALESTKDATSPNSLENLPIA